MNNLSTYFQAYLEHALKAHANLSFFYCDDNRVPSTGKAIFNMFNNALSGNGHFFVFDGANDANNLFFASHVNLLYRALHDVHHAQFYPFGKGTTKVKHEKFLNCFLAFEAYKFCLTAFGQNIALQVFFAVYHDTVGQTDFYSKNKTFCDNQKKLTIDLLNDCTGYRFTKNNQIALALQVMCFYLTDCKVI